MRNFKRIMMLTVAISLIALIVACDQISSEQKKLQDSTKSVSLTISAAASLKDAMEEIKAAYIEEKTNVGIIFNFGSSGSLQQQIEQGADVDLFISAATKQMDALQDKGLIMEGTRKEFLENEIVLVAPKDSEIKGFTELSNNNVQKIAMGEPKSVPVGGYAEEILTKMNILDSIKLKVVYAKDVKEVLSWVETGNADVGIVYKTDAKVSEKVKVVAKAPEGSHKPVYYPAAVIKASNNPDEAKAFVDYLYSSEAKPIFEKYGFKFSEN